MVMMKRHGKVESVKRGVIESRSGWDFVGMKKKKKKRLGWLSWMTRGGLE